ncbi:MAG: transposase [Chloroflexi bacterium]|nr:transposase [Chloroflexota bacterium]
MNAEAYLLGVSTRNVESPVSALGISSLSKSKVSRPASRLDEQVTASGRGRCRPPTPTSGGTPATKTCARTGGSCLWRS